MVSRSGEAARARVFESLCVCSWENLQLVPYLHLPYAEKKLHGFFWCVVLLDARHHPSHLAGIYVPL